MAFINRVDLRAGELIAATFEELGSIWREIAVYFFVFILLSLLVWLSSGSGIIGGLAFLVGLPLYFAGQFLLYRALLRGQSGAAGRGWGRYFGLIGMAALLIVPIYLASIVFFVPGIILVSRWIAAPSFLLGTQRGVIASVRESWSASSGNTLAIALAFTVMLLVSFVAAVAIGAVAGVIGNSLASENLSGASVHVLPVLLVGLSVAVYRRLNEDDVGLSEVFA